jgi:hypothetical protein
VYGVPRADWKRSNLRMGRQARGYGHLEVVAVQAGVGLSVGDEDRLFGDEVLFSKVSREVRGLKHDSQR